MNKKAQEANKKKKKQTNKIGTEAIKAAKERDNKKTKKEFVDL